MSLDEKAAQAELERLRDAIQAARQARQRKSEEFDRFVQGFRSPPSAPAAELEVATPPAPRPAEHTPGPSSNGSSPGTVDSLPRPIAVLPAAAAADATSLPASRRSTGPPRRLDVRIVGAIAVIAVIAIGFLWSRSGREIGSPPAVTSAGGSQVPTASPQAPTPSAPPPAVAPHAVMLELSTVRPVWMRVVVDDQKKLEGTVASGERLQFAGDHLIVVRVGNAGDVLVKSGNREVPFGDAGQPLTRTFPAPGERSAPRD